MTSPKWTPRPWGIEPVIGVHGEVYFLRVLRDESPYRGSVCEVFDAEHMGGITIEERDANAALIAEAPALYKALDGLVSLAANAMRAANIHFGAFDIDQELSDARAALAKVRGEVAE